MALEQCAVRRNQYTILAALSSHSSAAICMASVARGQLAGGVNECNSAASSRSGLMCLL
jgi:hypothetical protein